MLKHDVLINKGFSLNEYDGHGKYYELVETNEIYQKIILLSQMDNDRQPVFMGWRYDKKSRC